MGSGAMNWDCGSRTFENCTPNYCYPEERCGTNNDFVHTMCNSQQDNESCEAIEYCNWRIEDEDSWCDPDWDFLNPYCHSWDSPPKNRDACIAKDYCMWRGTEDECIFCYAGPDNCWLYNPGQEDLDENEIGDVCEETDPPIIDILIQGTEGKNDWYISPVTWKIRAYDDLSGISSMEHNVEEQS